MDGPVPFHTDIGGAQTVIHTVDLGDGRVADIEAPANATPEQLYQAYQASQAPAAAQDAAPGLDGAPAEQQLAQADRLNDADEATLRGLYHTGSAGNIAAFLHSRGRMSDASQLADYVAKRDAGKPVADDPNYAGKHVETTGLGAALRGADQGLTLGLGDEAHGFLNGVGALLGGGSYSDAYNKTVDSDRALLGSDSQNHELASVAGNLAGGAVLPFGLAKVGLTPALEAVALKAGQEAVAAGATADAAKLIAARAVARRMAVEGAGYGGAYGAGSAEGGPGARIEGGSVGAAVGGAGGAALGALGVRGAVKAAQPAAIPTLGQEVLAAGDRLGITPFAPDVAGPTTRRAAAAIAQTPGGAKQIIDAAGRVTSDARSARDTIAAAVGNALNPSEAGETALAGAKQYIARTSTQGNAMYRAAEAAANGTRVTPTEAIANLDQHIADLSQTPGGADGLERLQGLRDALAAGDHSVQGIRNMRTAIRDQFASDGLRGTDIERRANQVVDAANRDVVTSLNDAGNGQAANLYRRADQFWRERLATIDNTLAPIIGKNGDRSGEQVAAALQSNLRGNGVRLDKFVNALPLQEQADVRASLIGRLGTAAKGAQNAEGDAFSLSTFLTHWNDISESSKSRLFGVETRSALNDLAKVAQGAKEAQRYANHSNTGGVVGMLATGASGALGLKTLGLSIAAPYLGGKLLANPTFARWLARAPKTSLGNASYIERLGRIARAEPSIASEVLGFQQKLTGALASSPNRAAADEAGNSMVPADGNNIEQDGQYQGTQP